MNKKLISLLFAVLSFTSIYAANVSDDDFPEGITLWQSPDAPAILTNPSHRIPTITRCSDGSLLAVADYRLHLSDIGVSGSQGISQIELRYRRSTDGGETWSEQQTVCERNTSDASDWRWAMGDASLVADKESGEVLMMCAAGSVGMGASTAAKPIRTVCFRSHDNGQTWDEGTDMTDYLYSLYNGEATALFITSGSMCQSNIVKIDDFYRIYVAFPIRTKTLGNSTGVIFSDDFGKSWNVLGGAERFANGIVYEEGKVAELPDGSIVLMVRDDAGRTDTTLGKKNFCRYIFEDINVGSGQWTMAASGITGMAAATNNTLLIVPAKRSNDDTNLHLALVALPFHTDGSRDAINNYGRKNVGFVYKEISSEEDYADGKSLSEGWVRGLQVTNRLSAYTDLVALDNQRIGLLFEDNGKQGRGLDGNNETEAYDIVFHSFSIEEITSGQYCAAEEDITPDKITLADNISTTNEAIFDIIGRKLNENSLSKITIRNGKKQIEK